MEHPVMLRRRFPPEQRILVISDIHAHRALLERLLEKCAFGGDDFLIVLGDILECGEDNLGCLRQIMALQEQGRCLALAGNWDFYVRHLIYRDDPVRCSVLQNKQISLRKQYGSSFLGDCCRELGISLEGDMAEILPKVRRAFRKELDFIGGMPFTLDMGDYFLVHGGVPVMDESVIAGMDPYAILKNDAFAEQGHRFDRWMIVGHWPVKNYCREYPSYRPRVDEQAKLISIDGGCGKTAGEQMNALILHPGSTKREYVFVDDLPRVTALDAQKASEGSHFLRWEEDRRVELLSKEGGVCRVRHVPTGWLLDTPEVYLHRRDGVLYTRDVTDYRLPVSPGDTLSVLEKMPRALYCKNGDIEGWYFGKWA